VKGHPAVEGFGHNSERPSTSKRKTTDFVICIWNRGYEASLELRKIYQAIPDTGAAIHHLLRVTDESGEDCLYPQDFLLPLNCPRLSRRHSWR
jgi:hypothetical protein